MFFIFLIIVSPNMGLSPARNPKYDVVRIYFSQETKRLGREEIPRYFEFNYYCPIEKLVSKTWGFNWWKTPIYLPKRESPLFCCGVVGQFNLRKVKWG